MVGEQLLRDEREVLQEAALSLGAGVVGGDVGCSASACEEGLELFGRERARRRSEGRTRRPHEGGVLGEERRGATPSAVAVDEVEAQAEDDQSAVRVWTAAVRIAVRSGGPPRAEPRVEDTRGVEGCLEDEGGETLDDGAGYG
jgi:hypothetical protein